MTNASTCLYVIIFSLILASVSYWFACSCAATLALALIIGGSTLVGWSSRLDLSVVGGSKLGSLYSELVVSGVWAFSGVTGV